ncbi:Protein transport protein Sec61 subunit gamma [Hondaea fermentalgiana]|uniref:Protein transport protein Sec61 subunit gamma n=1 Tax=Hondaea fermentalgiana TaxID=2315210 RepID=A0A2R5GJV4_9STRA|nr:Protein transport protein Sec61 subunit gamma [Hondaea fermentalgiana]|eukprot:GBG28923.1 Protein transport protein Sec61 subunit gamma [Hondaea fermentalgiana]
MSSSSALNESVIEPLVKFAKDSKQLVAKCTKPDRKEFEATAKSVAMGFLVIGMIGFFVKLIHIPINNILIGS